MGELVIATCRELDRRRREGLRQGDRVRPVRPEFHAENVDVQTVPNVGSYDNAFLAYVTDRDDEEIDHYIERSWGTMFCTQQPPQVVDETEAPAPVLAA